MSELPSSLWDRLNNSNLIRFLLLFASGWAAIELLNYFEMVVVIFTCATVLAFLLSYPVRWVSRYLPRGVAVLIVFGSALILLAAAIATLSIAFLSQGTQLVNNVTEFLDSLTPVVADLESLLETWNIEVDLAAIEATLREQAVGLLSSGFSLVQSLLANLVHLILIAVVAFFMLLDGAQIWRFLLRAAPSRWRHRLTVTIQRNLLGFFWGRLLLSIFFGISTFIVFIILGAPYPLILAAIAGVFDLIPGIGATLGISLVALILLTQSIWMSVQVIVSCILLQQVEENLLLPHVMQGSLNINPVVMFFALLVGARIAGILGIFLAIPIAGVIVSLFEINEMKARSQTPPSSTSPPDDNSSPDDAVQAKDNQLPNSGHRLRHMDDRDKINEKNEPRDND